MTMVTAVPRGTVICAARGCAVQGCAVQGCAVQGCAVQGCAVHGWTVVPRGTVQLVLMWPAQW